MPRLSGMELHAAEQIALCPYREMIFGCCMPGLSVFLLWNHNAALFILYEDEVVDKGRERRFEERIVED